MAWIIPGPPVIVGTRRLANWRTCICHVYGGCSLYTSIVFHLPRLGLYPWIRLAITSETLEKQEKDSSFDSKKLKMEVGLSLNALVRLPLSSSSRTREDVLVKHSLVSTRTAQKSLQKQTGHSLLVVEAKGKRGMQARQFQRPPTPSLPKIEDDGNPKFVIFIRMANVYLWYPLSLVTGGTTAKIMVAAKDNFLGKYIYKDTLARNLAAVIYRDEKEIQKTAFKQHRVLRSATEFRYGYKLVENGNVRAALSTTDVIELPTQDQLKTVVDKVKDFFGDAKESFGKLTSLNSTSEEAEEEVPKEKAKVKG